MSDRNTTPKPMIDQAVREMPSALRGRYEEARSLLRNATYTENIARYRVGRIVQEIRQDPQRYGVRAVPLLARALARDETTLYRYARVAEVWPEPEFIEIIGQRMPDGSPLSWSHLLEIATASTSEERERLVSDALVRGLSVREVSAIIRHQEPTPSSNRSPALSRLRRLVDVCKSLERVAIDDKILERLPVSLEAHDSICDAVAEHDRAIARLTHSRDLLKKAENQVLTRAGQMARDDVARAQQMARDDDDDDDAEPPTKIMRIYGMEVPPPKKGGSS